MKLKFGEREFDLGGKYLSDDLRQSNDLLDDPAAARAAAASATDPLGMRYLTAPASPSPPPTAS